MTEEDVIAYATADWHVPERPNGGAWTSMPEIGGDSLFALEQVVNLCVRDDVPLLAAGDLVDGPDPEPATLAELYRILRKLTEPVYYVLGNHERNRDWLSPLDDRVVRSTNRRRVLKHSGVSISGLSCCDREREFDEQIAKMPPTDVGLYHQQWFEFMKGAKYRVSSLPRHKLAICGDVHVRKTISTESGPVLALSPGPLAPQSATEVQPHVVWAVKRDLTVSAIPIRGRTYVNQEITSEADAETALRLLHEMSPDEGLPERIGKPLLTLIASIAVDGFLDAAYKVAEKRGVLLRVYARASGKVERRPDAPVNGTSSLIEAIQTSQYPEDARRLAIKLLAPGPTPGRRADGRKSFT